MESSRSRICHIVAMPYPGRGHINSMINFCNLLAASFKNRILNLIITFVLTEEWLGFMASHPKPPNIRFASIPNVVPSELVRASDMYSFLKAVWTKMEGPFEHLLDTDQLREPPPTLIMADTFLSWAIRVGNRRNIPVASFWTMCSSMYSFLHHFHLLVQNGHYPANIQENGEEVVDYLPGISSTCLQNLPRRIDVGYPEIMQLLLEQFTWVPKAQHLLIPTIYELEEQAMDALAPNFTFPIYTIGPSIPYFNPNNNSCSTSTDDDYFQWLDHQPIASVLYVSLGSFLSVSTAQMDEIAMGLRESGVPYLWIARGDACRVREASGDMGLVLPWCDQLRVLSHSSVGGFLTHCGWNSVQESLFAAVPFLTFPLYGDQDLNSKLIVDDWKIGWRMKKYGGNENLVSTREEIASLVSTFMNLENKEGKEMRKRAKNLQQMCQAAIAIDGSSATNINSFITDISKC